MCIMLISPLVIPRKRIVPCEQHERQTSTRSLVIRHPLNAGHALSKEDLKITRPEQASPLSFWTRSWG